MVSGFEKKDGQSAVQEHISKFHEEKILKCVFGRDFFCDRSADRDTFFSFAQKKFFIVST